ncbi:MAG: rRNA ((2251)-2-O)-methyltransferase RlmB [Caulobacteraceae bacterium]|nr:rRNA ((2251)-2-O)-methyltransferase RlmB [Caulobacteraceae bacterium]
MTSHRQRNDAPRPNSGGRKKPFHRGPARPADTSPGEWLWGSHAVEAALKAGKREVLRALATADRARGLQAAYPGLRVEVMESGALGQTLPQNAVHQGIAIKATALEPLSIEEIGAPAKGVLLMLDQVTDPQNVGAIFRSAAAFGARGVILQDRHAPALAGALAKAAAGAVDLIPHARVVNLSRALERLADLGWRTVGLDSAADGSLGEVLDGRPTVLVMGSEGEGLRRLVAEHCDAMATIPMPGGFESLNVSAAAAVALYEASRPR